MNKTPIPERNADGGSMMRLVVPILCPFCGSKSGKAKAMPKREYDRMIFMIVECQCCGACGPVSTGEDSQKAIRKWNERVSSDRPTTDCGNSLSLRIGCECDSCNKARAKFIQHNAKVVAPGSAVQKPELENELDR